MNPIQTLLWYTNTSPYPIHLSLPLCRKIINGEIPSNKIFETDTALAILDAFPVAAGHALLLPKVDSVDITDMVSEVLCVPSYSTHSCVLK